MSFPSANTPICTTELADLILDANGIESRYAQVCCVCPNSVSEINDWFLETADGGFVHDVTFFGVEDIHNGIINSILGQAVYHPDIRLSCILDPSNRVRWMSIGCHDVGRSIPEILRVLDALQTGKPCPAGWQPGDNTIEL